MAARLCVAVLVVASAPVQTAWGRRFHRPHGPIRHREFRPVSSYRPSRHGLPVLHTHYHGGLVPPVVHGPRQEEVREFPPQHHGPVESGYQHQYQRPDVSYVPEELGCRINGRMLSAGETWYMPGCRRGTCVRFGYSYYVSEDRCTTEYYNSNYACVIYEEKDRQYPHCCPYYKCNPEL